MSFRDVPSPAERAKQLELQDPIEVQTRAIKKREQVIKKLCFALQESGVLTQQEIEQVLSGKVSDHHIKQVIKNSEVNMHPPKAKVQVRYVLGFTFSPTFSHVLLLWKNRPAWQAGKLNGIGGKIEEGETAEEAMAREFTEETGIVTGTASIHDAEGAAWRYIGKRSRPAMYDDQPASYELFIYATQLPLKTMKAAYGPAEEVICLPLNAEILRRRGVPGLAWNVDAAMCSLLEGFHINVKDPVNLEVAE